MKKLYYLIILTVILGLVLTGCLLSNVGQVPTTEQSGISYLTKAGTKTDPELFPLYADQDWEVGEVLVWDDGEELCVKYRLFDGTGDDPENVVADGWGITETHLAVATSLSGIPTNKSGNPQPGKFPYGADELGGVASWPESDPFCIPPADLEVECGDTLFIAAHAVIEKEKCKTVSREITPTLTWKRSSEDSVSNFPGYGAQWDPIIDGFTIPLTGELVWDGGTGGTQNFTGLSTRNDVSWASWDYAASVPRGGNYNGNSDLRRFNATFTLSAEEANNITKATLKVPDYVADDVIPINDNVYIFLNETLTFWGGTGVQGAAGNLTTFEGMGGTLAIPVYHLPLADQGILDITGWYILGTFPNPNIADFKDGTNELDVFTEENQEGGGMAELILTLEYAYEECTTYSETAWAANDEIEGDGEGTIQFIDSKSWATYFEYTTVECCTNVPEVINGGFELPVVTTKWDIYDSGTAGLGWTVEWYDGSTSYGGQDRPEPAHLELHKSGTVVIAYEGAQYAELDTDWGILNGEPASVRIYQDLETCPGEEYTLTYAWSPRNPYECVIEVYWDGVLVDTHSGNTSGWILESYPVTASGYSTSLMFVETGPADSFGMFFDDVSVE